MNLKLDFEILGWLLVGEGTLQLLPLLYAFVHHEAVGPFVWGAFAALTFGLSVALTNRGADRRMRSRDGFFVVSGAWVLMCVFGAIPFLLSGQLAPVDALFESTSGFTTTGATVLSSIEATPKALLLWRAMTQWLGGMGMILFAVAVLPVLGLGGMTLFQAEVPGPIAEKLTPRVRDTAQRLWGIYAAITLLGFVALWSAGMDSFDALCHALTAVSTGGFSTRDLSIGAFHSGTIEWVVIGLMLLGGMNFVLLWLVLTGRFKRATRDAELRMYLGILTLAALATYAALRGGEVAASTGENPFRDAVFQVVSLATTTGYGTADYDLWPPLFHAISILLLLCGAMAGSTGGGVKTLHLLLVWRKLKTTIAASIHRHAIQTVRYRGQPVAETVLMGVFAFLAAYLLLVALCAAVVASAGADLITAFSASLTTVGNVGPGLAAIGPTDSFSLFPGYVKLTLCLAMIAGRLELLTFFAVVTPSFWRR